MSPAAVPPALPATAHVQPAFAEFAGWAHGSPRRTPYGWSTYIVRRGDTLSELAARHHTTVAQLVAKNRMRSAGTVLRAGERLAVPRLRPAPSLRRTVSAGRVDARYAVRPGDTLGGIAARHGLSARQLAAANQISTHAVLRIGQRLTVPGGQSATRSTVKASRSSAAGSFGASYTVKAGDTLSGIAARYGVSQTALLKANHFDSQLDELDAIQTELKRLRDVGMELSNLRGALDMLLELLSAAHNRKLDGGHLHCLLQPLVGKLGQAEDVLDEIL